MHFSYFLHCKISLITDSYYHLALSWLHLFLFHIYHNYGRHCFHFSFFICKQFHTEEIASRQKQVDETVDAGLELMKHISNDEALQLKDKLDSLQRRYSDLTSRGADLLKNAHDVLPLVEQFH